MTDKDHLPLDRASMTESDIIAPNTPAVEPDEKGGDIAHDHALFAVAQQASEIVESIASNSAFVEEGVDIFDKLVDKANKENVSLALISHDISNRWRETGDNEALSEDLQFLIKQSTLKYRNPIHYEGLDMSEHDLQWRKTMDDVGEKVRLNPDFIERNREQDSSWNIAPESFADRELTIAKVIVRGEEAHDGFGGTRPSAIAEYEFEEEPGRYNANQFIEAAGRDHAFGVTMVKDERLWLVPLDVKDYDNPTLDGPAREIVGYTGKALEAQNPNGIEDFKDHLKDQGPSAGEYYYRSRDGYQADGPVELYSSPWQSSAEMGQIDLAEKAIAQAIKVEAPERVLSKGPPEAPTPAPERGVER